MDEDDARRRRMSRKSACNTTLRLLASSACNPDGNSCSVNYCTTPADISSSLLFSSPSRKIGNFLLSCVEMTSVFFVVPFSTPTRSVLRCRSRCKGVAAAATVEKTPLKKALSTVWQLRSRVARVRKCNGYATTTFDVSVWRSAFANSESTRLSHVCWSCNFVFSFLFSLRIGISSSSTDC